MPAFATLVMNDVVIHSIPSVRCSRDTLTRMSPRMVSYRSELKSRIAGLLDDVAMACPQTEESLVALAVALADHREEGRALFPRVLICDDLDVVLRNLQGSNAIRIGTGPRGPDTVLRALKKCAPLADEGWAIWIDRDENRFDFGVFREPGPTAVDLRHTLMETAPDNRLRALLVAQFAPGIVEVLAAGDGGLRIHFSGIRDDRPAPEDAETQVVELFCADLDDDDQMKQSFVSFGNNIFHSILRRGHGALIAVAPSDDKSWATGVDAVVLDEPIDIASLVKAHVQAPTPEVLSELLAYVDLLAGMLNSDGITVFDTAGRVLAFNWFIKTDTASLGPREQLGGARHRAFGILKQLVDGQQLRGAFIRSSDGGESAYERTSTCQTPAPYVGNRARPWWYLQQRWNQWRLLRLLSN